MRIGILLTGDYTWAGGLYYSLNLIQLLSEIASTKTLKVVVIVNASTPTDLLNNLPKNNVEVHYLDKKNLLYRIYHKLKNDRFAADINALNLDVLYPLIAYDDSHRQLKCRVIYWMYDFQHKFLPQLFSAEEIAYRDEVFLKIARHANDVVFSSHDSRSHFEQFYSESKCRRHVYNFVSLIGEVYNIAQQPHPYFIVCNQFWPHKNHTVVLKAMKVLASRNIKPKFIFTGKYDDARNKDYVTTLLDYLKQNGLETQVNLTGFISRSEQVTLLQQAIAVVQPSFFEGWSTVVEDAKALGKYLVLSDLPVHREQAKSRVAFFNPENDVELADRLAALLATPPETVKTDYHKTIGQSKEDLIHLFNIS